MYEQCLVVIVYPCNSKTIQLLSCVTWQLSDLFHVVRTVTCEHMGRYSSHPVAQRIPIHACNHDNQLASPIERMYQSGFMQKLPRVCLLVTTTREYFNQVRANKNATGYVRQYAKNVYFLIVIFSRIQVADDHHNESSTSMARPAYSLYIQRPLTTTPYMEIPVCVVLYDCCWYICYVYPIAIIVRVNDQYSHLLSTLKPFCLPLISPQGIRSMAFYFTCVIMMMTQSLVVCTLPFSVYIYISFP